MSEKLKPCPFCGGTPGIKQHAKTGRYYIKCYGICGCMQLSHYVKSDVIKIWNKRVELKTEDVPLCYPKNEGF